MLKIWLPVAFCAIASGASVKQQSRSVGARLAVNAEPATLGEFPHQVSLQVDGSHSCGGALISSTHVLTASHCVDDFIKNPKTLLSQNLAVEVGSVVMGSGKTHEIRRLSRRVGFDSSQHSSYFMPNDIAVITLKTPVRLSSHVKPVGLPDPGMKVPEGSPVWVSGFGSVEAENPVSRVLRKAELFVLPESHCNEFYETNFKKTVLSSHICTQRGPGDGTCQGDSGGPLIWNSKVIGVVSGGTGRCNAGYPDVYTRVSSHLDYIRNEMNHDFRNGDRDERLAKAIDIDQLKSGHSQQSTGFRFSEFIPQPEQRFEMERIPPVFHPPQDQFYPQQQQQELQQEPFFPIPEPNFEYIPIDFYKSNKKSDKSKQPASTIKPPTVTAKSSKKSSS